MNLFSVLGIGASGIRSASYGAGVAGHNATNAGTPGYSRRIAHAVPGHPGPPIGGGVVDGAARRVIDLPAERRLLLAGSNLHAAESEVQLLDGLDRTLGSDDGVIGALSEFEAALSDLSATPGDIGVREAVLGRADTLAASFRAAAKALDDARAAANERARAGVGRANELLSQASALTSQIADAEAGGTEASDLRDRRDEVLRSLAAELPLRTLTHDDGSISVSLESGEPLLSRDGRASLLAVGATTTGDVTVLAQVAGASVDISAKLTSGTIGGALLTRDGTITTAQASLDTLAFDVATAYNATHSAGFGLDGVGGRPLFAAPAAVPGAARSLAVSSAVAGQPDAIAAAIDPLAIPGDGRNALALAALATSSIASGGTQSARGAFSSLVGAVGRAIADGEGRVAIAESAFAQATTLRETISGVSEDEEMITLMKYQHAHQAALRLVAVADEMLGELMQLKR